MANPLPNEKEIYEKIGKENIQIDPIVWELIGHYIGNDVVAIQLIAGSHIIGDDPEPIPVKDAQKLMAHCDGIRDFLKKLKSVTVKKA